MRCGHDGYFTRAPLAFTRCTCSAASCCRNYGNFGFATRRRSGQRRILAAIDRQIPRARENGARLQAVEAADRVAEMRGIGVADVPCQMREIDVLIGEVEQLPRTLPGAERAEGNAGLFLEQMQEARGRQSCFRGASRGGHRL